ncbi:MAG: PQQ-binding-like beta-propeller repeat protein [Eubacterium sp.]|nr:PQQ-binding-like beta-propeller repeat protein [Eubacterium sp.]
MVIYLTDSISGRRVFEEDGVFLLTPGRTYSYSATCPGYIGVQGSYTVPDKGGALTIALETAVSSSLPQLPSEWPHLRLDNNNNAVADARIPTESNNAVLYWATQLGDGYDSGACSPPILVDGYLYVYSDSTLYKLDTMTGQVVASAPMAGASSFAINPPTYANGMIFVGLSNGRVQAFNASTLESLWLYTDPLGGQPNCSLVYQNGYVYTGFWVGETSEANFVCLTATDEDPSQPKEAKLASWTYSNAGGYYWSGAFVCDDFLLLGTDDGGPGARSSARLLSLEPKTGRVLDERVLSSSGDVRSSITYYNGNYYFTSKGGMFYKASVNSSGDIVGLNSLNLGGMSTSTPVIYNNRAYVGVCGSGQFKAYSGHRISVIDLNYWEIAYSVQTQGYPQTSGIVTNAYEGESGSVYVYFFDNFTPGKLRVLKDMPGQTSTSQTTTEAAMTVAYNVFEPIGDQAQFAICSPIADKNGTLYFKKIPVI